MSNTIITSVVTGGVNNHTTVVEEINALSTDFVTQGVVGAITLNTGSGGSGSFCVNADATADMGVTIKAGQAYIAATPASQSLQVLRARAAADYTSYVINANASGSTKYDWIYLSVNATNANAPAADATNVTSIYTSRSSSNTTDNGTPPSFGLLLAVVTVVNGASSIANANISDRRLNASIGTQGGSLVLTQQSSGADAIIQAAGPDSSVSINLKPKGNGSVKGVVDHLYNPCKFSVYRNASWSFGGVGLSTIIYDTKTFDTGNNYSTSTGNFTAPVAGFYYFTASANFSPYNGTSYYIELDQNGVTAIIGQQIVANTVNNQSLSVSGLIQCATNDTIQVRIYSGNAGTTGGNAGSPTIFCGFLVSAT